MPLPLFADSQDCRLRVHCATCRNRDGGRQFRASLSQHFSLPADAPDFACPHGVEWGAASVPARVAVPAKPIIPLAGDLLEQAINLFGGDRIAKFLFPKGCGCRGRKEWWNRKDRALRKLLARKL